MSKIAGKKDRDGKGRDKGKGSGSRLEILSNDNHKEEIEGDTIGQRKSSSSPG